MKTKMPSEEEVRRFFQEAYYTTLSYDNDTHETKVKYNDLTGMVYPVGESDE